MAMASTFKLSFHRRLFIYLITLSFSYLLCFLVFQYYREKTYKVERLNDHLQIINTQLGYIYMQGGSVEPFLRSHGIGELEGIRVTIIQLSGKVIYDSKRPAYLLQNHAGRPEVRDAISNGEGYIINRMSASTDVDYFYSATRIGNLVVRSALPYSMTLVEVLRVDSHFIWLMLFAALFIAFICYFLTHRLGHNINHLREFAMKADKGEPIENMEPFMKDELGEVSNHIVRLYVQLRQAKDALVNEHNLVLHQEQEQIRIKRQLTQNINHELKTPVSSIEGYLETVIHNPKIDEAKKDEFIKKSYEQVIRMSNLLGDVATITRMDEASMMIEKERLCLSNLIRETFDDMSQKLQEKDISVLLDFPENLFIVGNQSLLQSIFRNLLDNAISYSGCNQIVVHLMELDDDRYVFSFSDNGVGIDEKHLSRIFERFYRVDKGRSRKLGGTGLGLSIVKNAVVLHGGTIVARTHNGGGLEFVFVLKQRS